MDLDLLQGEIEAVNIKFMDAVAAQDPTAVSKIYTEDCRLSPPGMDVVIGREGVIDVFGNMMKNGAAKINVVIDEVGPMSAGGDTIFERSKYTFFDTDGEVFIAGTYLVIWKKVDGAWLAYIDHIKSVQ